MKIEDAIGYAFIGGSIVSVAGYIYLDGKKRKHIESQIETLNWREYLKEDNELHAPLIRVIDELTAMLKKSVINFEGKYRFKPEYPLSLSLLVRAAYEHSVKLFMKVNNIVIKSERPNLGYLERVLSRHLDESYPDSDINACLKKMIQLELRAKTNNAAHNPDKSKSIASLIEENEEVFRFVKLVMQNVTSI